MQQIVTLSDELVDQILNYLPTKNLDDLLNLLLQDYLKKCQEDDFECLLNKTKGTWQQGDGLNYQIKNRDNWD